MAANTNEDIVVGTCMKMCSLAEATARQNQRRLHIFEKPSNTHRNYPVKEFSRSAAGKQLRLSELRPAGVLLSSMNYLLEEIVDRVDQPWHVVYHFVFDRIRAIRQDMVIQRIADESAVEILEKAARFHTLAGFLLCENSLDVFDPRINDDHLQESLKRLLILYNNYPSSQNREEFESYYLLHNLGSLEAMEHCLQLPKTVRTGQVFQISWNISLQKLLGNYVDVFRLAKKLPFLASCLLQKHFATIRSTAVAVMNAAYSNINCQFPLVEMTDILAFDNENETMSFLAQFGIEVTNGFVKFSKKSFHTPSQPLFKMQCKFVNDKKPTIMKEVLQGQGQSQAYSHCQVKTSLYGNQDGIDKQNLMLQIPCYKKQSETESCAGAPSGAQRNSSREMPMANRGSSKARKSSRGRGRGRSASHGVIGCVGLQGGQAGRARGRSRGNINL